MSVREYAILYPTRRKVASGGTIGGGDVLLGAGQHKLDGLEHQAPTDITRLNATTALHGLMPKGSGNSYDVYKGNLSQGRVVATDLSTTETDTTKKLAPDGLGGVEWAGGVSSGGAAGEILISDTPSTPLVFADLIQNEAQNDLVYADW